MSVITYGPIIGYVFRKNNKWSCRIILETLAKNTIQLEGKYFEVEYLRFKLGKAYMHRFIIHGLDENTHYSFKFDNEVCTLFTPSIGEGISVYTLSCDGGNNYSYYMKNARNFYNLSEDKDETLWTRLYEDICKEEKFTLALHIGDNFYCDDVVRDIFNKYTFKTDGTSIDKITQLPMYKYEILSRLQIQYRKIFNNPYKKKTLSVNSHLMMHDDHEYYDDYRSSKINNDKTELNDILIENLSKMFKYYQYLLYKDPHDEDLDIYIDDYAPLGIAIPDERTNRKYFDEKSEYPIFSEKQMNNMKLFFENPKLTSIAISFTIPLTLLTKTFNTYANMLAKNASDGWATSDSRVNQRKNILDILFKSDKKIAVFGGDLHFGQMSYLTNNKKVIPFIVTSGISSCPPDGYSKIVYGIMRLFQSRCFLSGIFSSRVTNVHDFNYCKFKTSENWDFFLTQKFTLKTYLREDCDLTISYEKSYSCVGALLSSLNFFQ